MKLPIGMYSLLAALAAIATLAAGASAVPVSAANETPVHPNPHPRAALAWSPPQPAPLNVQWTFSGCYTVGVNTNQACYQSTADRFSGDWSPALTPEGGDCPAAQIGIWCGKFVDPAHTYYPGNDPANVLPTSFEKWTWMGCITEPCFSGTRYLTGAPQPDGTPCRGPPGLWCAS